MILRFVRHNYDTILTLTFAVVLAGHAISILLVSVFGVEMNNPTELAVLAVIAPIILIALLALYVLIFAGSLRDEYIDKIWQRAARSFAIVVLALPWLFGIGWKFREVLFARLGWLPADPNALLVSSWGNNPMSAASLQLSGMEYLIGLLWTYGPLVFVALFKWHAWRDKV